MDWANIDNSSLKTHQARDEAEMTPVKSHPENLSTPDEAGEASVIADPIQTTAPKASENLPTETSTPFLEAIVKFVDKTINCKTSEQADDWMARCLAIIDTMDSSQVSHRFHFWK